MTKEQNVVLWFYSLLTSMYAGRFLHSWSAFFMVYFFFAFALKLANCMASKMHTHEHGHLALTEAEPFGGKHGKPTG